MSLCKVCQSIQWQNLPPFLEDIYAKNATGLQHVHSLFPTATLTNEQRDARLHYHGSLEELSRAAEAGCPICLSVKEQADALLAEIDGLEGIEREMEGAPPDFDMWLTRRPVGGDGFWVLSQTKQDSELVSESGPPATLLIAAFGFGAAEESGLAAEFRGRPIREVPDAEAFTLIRGWVAECNASHECCAMDTTLPTRLIEVEPLEYQGQDSVKLVEFKQGEVGKYTALSYSREHGISGGLTGVTGLSGSRSTITMTDLPKAFHDAILLTRQIGVKYFWVDALCIPNDEAHRFGRDSAAFGSIYQNAYVTLAATGAKDESQGLFFPRTDPAYIRIPQETQDGRVEDLWTRRLLLTKEFMRNPVTILESEPLCKSAWAFQERVLSPRTVHFAGDQVYFECLKQFRSEDGLCMDDRFPSAAKILPNDADRDGLSRWSGIIWHYSTCSLSDASDKLPALANIARAFSEILSDVYVAGLWKSSLIECLCWQSVDCKSVAEYRAPSWSWASVDGLVGVGFHTSTWKPMATIQHVNVELQDNTQPFGKAKAAWLKLEAPVVPLTVSDTKGYTGTTMLQVKDDDGAEGFHAGLDTMPKSYSDNAGVLREMELVAILLAETGGPDCDSGGCGSGTTYHGIIATPVDGKSDTLKRIGFILAGPEEFGSNKLTERNTVTLI